jgi:hypothetical protein
MFSDKSFKYYTLYSLNIIILDYKLNNLNHKYILYKKNIVSFKSYHSYNDIYMNYIKLYNDIYYTDHFKNIK